MPHKVPIVYVHHAVVMSIDSTTLSSEVQYS